MRIRIVAVGRLKGGPEKTLVDDYLDRFSKTGRSFGLGPAEVIEIDDRKGSGMASEAALLKRAVPEGSVLIALDERGKVMTSPEFAILLADLRDAGRRNATFLIGGADGLDPSLPAGADAVVSLGKMVWPHMLARVMLAEQIYRAATILAGSPYHRS